MHSCIKENALLLFIPFSGNIHIAKKTIVKREVLYEKLRPAHARC